MADGLPPTTPSLTEPPPVPPADAASQPATALLREFGHWLQAWTERVQAEIAQLETPPALPAAPPDEPLSNEATLVPDAAHLPPDAPPAHWLERVQQHAAPAHWLADVERSQGADAAPEVGHTPPAPGRATAIDPPPVPVATMRPLAASTSSPAAAHIAQEDEAPDTSASVQAAAPERDTPVATPQRPLPPASSFAPAPAPLQPLPAPKSEAHVAATLGSWLAELQQNAAAFLSAAAAPATPHDDAPPPQSSPAGSFLTPDRSSGEPVAANRHSAPAPTPMQPVLAQEPEAAALPDAPDLAVHEQPAQRFSDPPQTMPAPVDRRGQLKAPPAPSLQPRRTRLRLRLAPPESEPDRADSLAPAAALPPDPPALKPAAQLSLATAQPDVDSSSALPPARTTAPSATATKAGAPASERASESSQTENVRAQPADLQRHVSQPVTPVPVTRPQGAPPQQWEAPGAADNRWPPLPDEPALLTAQLLAANHVTAPPPVAENPPWPRLPASSGNMAQPGQSHHQRGELTSGEDSPLPAAPREPAPERWPALLPERAASAPNWRRMLDQQARRQRLDQEQRR